MMQPVLIIDNYDSFTYNLYQMVQAVTSRPVRVFRNDASDYASLMERLPSHIILSPGPGHPEKPSDFGVCRDIILNTRENSPPVLGVCLGHQGIAQCLGARIIHAPEVCHGKTSEIELYPTKNLVLHRLLSGIPRRIQVMRYHSLVIEESTLPSSLTVFAREQKNGLIMGIVHEQLPLLGVQFHPESIGTPDGQQLLRNFVADPS